MMNFNKSKIAAAVGAAALALSTQAGAVVVVGGDNGWEVSFDGNVNAFYTNINYDKCTNAGAACTGTFVAEDSSRVTSGFLPAFFSFNVKSPTVNGLTGSARISFAPAIQTNKGTNSIGSSGGLVGAQIDTREVLGNVAGSFGTISFGRTLGIFGRQAILKDMTLFGVGQTLGAVDFGTVTAGRIGHGYVYPDFEARISYKTPNMNGFQAEVGMYDPIEGTLGGGSGVETDTPRFEGELTYASAFSGGSFNLWADFLWQQSEMTVATTNPGQDWDSYGVGVGGQVAASGFEAVGYYYDGQNLGTGLKSFTPGIVAGTTLNDLDQDGWYAQGSYTFNGKTKVGFSYGESNQDADVASASPDVSNEMWTIGVYHDVNSWLKLIAEYSDVDDTVKTAANAPVSDREYSLFSVGAFIFW